VRRVLIAESSAWTDALRGAAGVPVGRGGAAVVGGCGVTGLTILDDGAMMLAAAAKRVTAAGYQPDPRASPQIMAGPYLHSARAIGSTPADTPAEDVAADPPSGAAATAVLVTLGAATVTLLGATKQSRLPRHRSVRRMRLGPRFSGVLACT
jgi:hypothetical protein